MLAFVVVARDGKIRMSYGELVFDLCHLSIPKCYSNTQLVVQCPFYYLSATSEQQQAVVKEVCRRRRRRRPPSQNALAERSCNRKYGQLSPIHPNKHGRH